MVLSILVYTLVCEIRFWGLGIYLGQLNKIMKLDDIVRLFCLRFRVVFFYGHLKG
jgi:hypothetical protein